MIKYLVIWQNQSLLVRKELIEEAKLSHLIDKIIIEYNGQILTVSKYMSSKYEN